MTINYSNCVEFVVLIIFNYKYIDSTQRVLYIIQYYIRSKVARSGWMIMLFKEKTLF